SAVARARASAARIVALRVERPRSLGAVARASGELGVPATISPCAMDARSLRALVRELDEANGSLLLGFGCDLDEAIAATSLLREVGDPACLGLAWELRPNAESLRSSSAVLLA